MVKALCLIGGSMIMAILTAILLLLFTSCTFSINMVHTQGEASDVVDETDDVNPDISPTLSVPLTGL